MGCEMKKTELPQECASLQHLSIATYQVGSRVTCNPPVMHTDSDWLVFTLDWQRFIDAATAEGFEVAGSVPGDALEQRDSQFTSLRRGDVNLVVTTDTEFLRKFIAATEVCKRLNLLRKPDRIALFQAVLYGNGCENE